MSNSLVSVLILSDKSSGSSILQNELCKHESIHMVERTPHAENETLFWLKASVLLGLPQNKMVYSGVVLTKEAARKSLINLLKDNIPGYDPPQDDVEIVFKGWEQLCTHYMPVFLEKSPHHLLSASALQLIFQAAGHLSNVNFKFIGLVRNPMDTIYSYWSRWNVDPVKKQSEWLTAYRNLLRLKEQYSSEVIIIRYEDLVRNKQPFEDICKFIDVEWNATIGNSVHKRSVSKWRTDPFFGFNLDDELIKLALEYGYEEQDLTNRNKNQWLWQLNRVINRRTYTYNINKRRLKNRFKKLLGR